MNDSKIRDHTAGGTEIDVERADFSSKLHLLFLFEESCFMRHKMVINNCEEK